MNSFEHGDVGAFLGALANGGKRSCRFFTQPPVVNGGKWRRGSMTAALLRSTREAATA